MGSFLDKPKTEKSNDSGHGNDLKYGLGAMQGWRVEMEDSHCSTVSIPKKGLEHFSFFAVFDGHAGGTVSKQSAKELLHSILNADPELFNELALMYSSSSPNQTTINSNQSPVSSSSSSISSLSSNNTNSPKNNVNSTNSPNANDKQPTSNNSINKNDTTNSDVATNASDSNINNSQNSNNINSTSNKNCLNSTADDTNNNNNNNKPTTPSKYTQDTEDRLKKAIRQGFLDLDDKLRHQPEFDRGEDKSGSTAIACLISPSHVYLINCGDSRAIMVSDNQVVLNTYDHKPINPIERERIQNAGGSVMIQRVNGSLAVSRALGDYEYKCVEGRGPCEQLVSPEPEVYVRERSDKDEFVVLACDGIWDVITNDNLKEFIHSRLQVTNDLVKLSNEILDMCLHKVRFWFFDLVLGWICFLKKKKIF